MQKIDLRKEWKHLYSPSSKAPEVVDVPTLQFVAVDGELVPGELPGESAQFQEAIQALYGAAYTLKFMSKQRKENPIDFPVMALEGLWWSTSGAFDFNRPADWCWRLMIMQPEHITQEMLQEALEQLERKKPSPALGKVNLVEFCEGLSIQIMHIGPYAEEPATIARLHAFADEHGYRLRGQHHEIYLGDPRRAAPERLKTILRLPVEPALEQAAAGRKQK